MTILGLIIWLAIGAIAAWLAGLILKGYGLGLVGNIVVGIIGAFIAGRFLPRIGFVLVGHVCGNPQRCHRGRDSLLLIGFFKKAA